ncbi:MAG: hypothetical protein HOV79_27170 [Hamadaea sp.]|nr:hypothetical protein [Hamadaea sp.]
MMRKALTTAVLAVALLTVAACGDDAGGGTGTGSATSAAAQGGSGDKTACETFTTASTKFGGEVQAKMADLTSAMSGDKAKQEEVLKALTSTYQGFAAAIKTAAGQASSTDLKDALTKMSTLADAAVAVFADPANVDASKAMAAMSNPELTAAQQTVVTRCSAAMK